MYVTKQGECWDEIAKNVYGSEKYIGFLMQNNMPLLDTIIFSAGVIRELRNGDGKDNVLGQGRNSDVGVPDAELQQ